MSKRRKRGHVAGRRPSEGFKDQDALVPLSQDTAMRPGGQGHEQRSPLRAKSESAPELFEEFLQYLAREGASTAGGSPLESSQILAVEHVVRRQDLYSFRGPMPPPELLAGYDDALPGSAERILAMAEREASHRHAMQKGALDFDRTDAEGRRLEIRRGQIFVFVLSALGLLISAAIAFVSIGFGFWQGTITASVTATASFGGLLLRSSQRKRSAPQSGGAEHEVDKDVN